MFNKIYISLLIGFGLFFLNSSFAYKEIIIENIDSKAVRVLKVVLDGQDFVVSSLSDVGGEDIATLAKNVWWSTAVNWVFFCPKDYSYCNWQTSSNFERVFLWEWEKFSQYWPDTWARVVFGFDKKWTPMLFQNNISDMEWYNTDINSENMDDMFFGLGNFPALLINWEDVIDESITLLDAKMHASGTRNFICWNEEKDTVHMWFVSFISLPKLPKYLKDNFDCYDALNLDAWKSLAMMYEWATLTQADRKIMDAWVIIDRDTYQDLSWEQNPIALDPYLPEYYYEPTQEDLIRLEKIRYWLDIIVDIYWSEMKTDLIVEARKLASLDVVKQDYRMRYLINQMLIHLFSMK